MKIDFHITPEIYVKVFSRVVGSNLTGKWEKEYADASLWTQRMKLNLIEIGRKLGYTTQDSISTEYCKIDFGYYSFGKSNDYFDWNFDVAIEHENNQKSWDYWFDEAIKLSHIACGLRVLITYLGPKQFLTFEQNSHNLLNLLSSRKFKCPASKWLFLIGPNWIVERSGDKRDFVAYTISANKLKPLSIDPILQK